MREFNLATQILENILQFSDVRLGTDVSRIRLEIGELMEIDAEQLSFCFDSIKHDTVLGNASLDIEFAPVVVRCAHCRREDTPKYWKGIAPSETIPALQCQHCGKSAEAIRGHDCVIKNLELAEVPNLPFGFHSHPNQLNSAA